jgi:hypothetical protein
MLQCPYTFEQVAGLLLALTVTLLPIFPILALLTWGSRGGGGSPEVTVIIKK